MIKINVGNRLRLLRRERNLSQKKLAEKTGISQSFISSIESNKQSPTVNSLERLCFFLGIDLADFFNQSEVTIPEHLKPLFKRLKYMTPVQVKHLTNFITSLNES